MSKIVGLSLDKDQLELIHSLRGFGKKDAEVVRNIVLAYLAENGYIEKYNKIEKNAGVNNE